MYKVYLLISILKLTFCYNQHSIHFSNKWIDYSHLDEKNIKKIEEMFYLNNKRYNPFRNRNYFKNITLNNLEVNGNYNNYNNLSINENGSLDDIFTKDYDIEQSMNKKKSYGELDEKGIFRYYKKPQVSKEDDLSGDSDENLIFEIVKNPTHTFKDVGGYDKIKSELMQSADILINYDKYKKYNVRTPKGIIFEGPPGNGKTLMAKGFSGELNISFIPVSGSEFSEKYVGVGASRIRKLFKLANKNKPCIIFIDEIDALARKRGNDMVSSNSEKDQTLNQLLINLDGFKESNGIFVIGATNRIDLLDPALIRPGRIDKNIYIGNPDSKTREEIIKIHIKGKPIEKDITNDLIIEMTGGFSGAQTENLLNEAMLKALRDNREVISIDDLEFIGNRIIAGWQSTENKYSDDIINRIIIHELGHALVGFFSQEHSLLIKVTINLWSPKTPGYTVFENQDEDSNIYTKNGLLSHLMVLLGGRIAEEIFYGYSVTTGAKKDLEQAYGLAKNMIVHYGMGQQNIYPDLSDHSKYLIDQEINKLLLESHNNALSILNNCKDLIIDCSEILKKTNLLKTEDIIKIINTKYPDLWLLYDIKKNYK
jgi:cell division protease FtsH